jgi:hypothetical protein
MRTIATLTALAIGVLAAASAAQAAAEGKPEIRTVTFSVTEPDFNFSCAPYGYSFDVLSTFTVTRRSILFYDGEELVKEIRHIAFAGTLFNSTDLSKTLPYAGTRTRTFDARTNTVTSVGLQSYSHPDGSGMISLGAGRLVFDAETFDLVTVAGRSPAEYEACVCAYLAG